MLDQNTFSIARHHHNLLHDAVEHGLDFSPLLKGDVDAIVERQLDLGEDRMIMLAEMVHDRS